LESLADSIPGPARAQSHPLQSSSRPTCIAAKEPDEFNGSKPKKLSEFLSSVAYISVLMHTSFLLDNIKVSFTLSYLSGTARQWFQTLMEAEPDWSLLPWLHDFALFLLELEDNFGVLDPVNEAAEEIENLIMASNSQISKYNVDFVHLRHARLA